MEFLGYILAAATCGGIRLWFTGELKKSDSKIGKLPSDIKSLISDGIGAFFGGSLEELLESIVKMAFKKRNFYFKNRRKMGFQAADELVKFLSELTPEQWQELAPYLTSLQTKETKDYAELFEKARGGDQASMRKIEKNLSDAVKKLREENWRVLPCGTDEMTEKLFGTKEIPRTTREFVQHLFTASMEMTYIGLGEEYRDVVMLMSGITHRESEKTNEKLEALESSVRTLCDMILQHGSDPNFKYEWEVEKHDGGVLEKVPKISEETLKDPYLFVKLECPVCHASGNFIRRRFAAESRFADCDRCGASYELIRNVSEVQDYLRETEKRLACQIGASEERLSETLRSQLRKQEISIVGELGEQLKQQSAAIVVELYESVFEKLSKETQKGVAADSEKLFELFHRQSEQTIQVKEELKNEFRSMETELMQKFLAQLDRVFESKERNNVDEEQLASILRDAGEGFRAIQIDLRRSVEDLTKGVERLNGIAERFGGLSRENKSLLEQMKELLSQLRGGLISVNIVRGKCPCCGKIRNLQKLLDGYACTACKAEFNMDEKIPLREAHFKQGVVYYGNTEDHGKTVVRVQLDARTKKCHEICRLSMDTTLSNCFSESSLQIQPGGQGGLLTDIHTIILQFTGIGYMVINSIFLDNLTHCFQNLRTIVPDKEIVVSERTLGKEWKYNREDHTLSREIESSY